MRCGFPVLKHGLGICALPFPRGQSVLSTAVIVSIPTVLLWRRGLFLFFFHHTHRAACAIRSSAEAGNATGMQGTGRSNERGAAVDLCTYLD